MPPFSTTAVSAAATDHGAAQPDHRIVTINVGGQIFQTTQQTLSRAGPKSLLSTLSSSPSIPFLDRDPALFSPLLSLLRSGRLPTSPSPDLLTEARHYGLSHTLISALSTPTTFRPFSLTRSLLLPLHGRDPVSSLAASPSGAVLVAHGGKVTAFDASLRHRSTTLTLLPAIDSIVSVSDHHAAVGATDFPGVHLINLDNRAVAETLTWDIHPSVTSASSTVQALASSPDLIFTSFESSRRNASAIVAFDVHTLQTVAEIGRKEVYGADLDSAIPATKLKWVPELNLLMAAGSHSGPSGLMGNVRLWDVRSGKAVWEVKENEDCFADVTVEDGLSAVFKVGVNSGDVYMSDLRKPSSVEPWNRLGGEGRREGNSGRKEGSGCRIEAYGSQVFCSRGGDVEMWSEIEIRGSLARRREDGLEGGRVMRRNVIGKSGDGGGSKIEQIVFGGWWWQGRRSMLLRYGRANSFNSFVGFVFGD